jgi:hypothetical protein
MLKIFCLFAITLLAVALIANPAYYPTTVLGELFEQTGLPGCGDAEAGMDVVHNALHSGEFISARFYTSSGALSNSNTEARFDFYDISAIPNAVFNGTDQVAGGGTDVANGNTYLEALEAFRFAPSPLKINITSFNSATGSVSVRVTMLDSLLVLNDQFLRLLLVENNVSASANRVVRGVNTGLLNLSGAGNYTDFTSSMDIQPAYNTSNLWLAAFAQLSDHTILQAASTLVPLTYQVRAAFPFSTTIVDSANYNFNSQPIWIFNTGAADNFTIQVLQDDGPTDWYFNFCSEDGLCYPGFVPHPFSMAAGEMAGWHLNLSVGSSGTAHFHMIIDSGNIEPYIIPFTYTTSDTPNDDPSLIVPVIALSQNYPNPFSATTAITLTLKRDYSEVDLEVFNCKGQLVNSLSAGELKSGSHTLTWDGTNSSGRQLAPGVYFYRLKNDSASTRKMLFLPIK